MPDRPPSQIIITEAFPKTGAAMLVEDTVQHTSDSQATIDEDLAQLQADLHDSIRGDGVSGRYERAKRFRQTVYAVVAFEACKTALPQMAEWYAERRSLVPPVDSNFVLAEYLNVGVVGAMSGPQHTALESSYWLARSTNAVIDAMQQGAHPAAALYPYIDTATTDYYQAQREWKAGPGKNRWPFRNPVRTVDGRRTVIGAMCLNVRLATNLLSAKAVHHLINVNPDADAAELSQEIAESAPRIGWLASTDRHLGWRPDWQDMPEGEHIGIVPEDGAAALLNYPTSKIVQPNAYAASVSGLPVMRDPDFCPHPLIKDGPVQKAASCAGDPRVRYQREGDRQAAGTFFARMGFAPENGDYFNLSAVVLAMGKSLVETEILPVYESNRLS
jgi:hypothetical protein